MYIENDKSMKIFRSCPGGFRFLCFEFYKVKGEWVWFEYLSGPCGCSILEIMGFGVTWLRNDCYLKADEEL